MITKIITRVSGVRQVVAGTSEAVAGVVLSSRLRRQPPQNAAHNSYQKNYATTTERCCFDLVSFATVSMKAPAFEFNSNYFKQRCGSKIMFRRKKKYTTSVDIQKVHVKKLFTYVDSPACQRLGRLVCSRAELNSPI